MTSRPPKRPRDFSQAAKLVIDIATGQVEDRPPTPEEQGKDPAAVALGRKGGAGGTNVCAATEGNRTKSRCQAMEALLAKFRKSVLNIFSYADVFIVLQASLYPLSAHRVP
jgi:hypothetical protein